MDAVARAVRRATDQLAEAVAGRAADPHVYEPRLRFELGLIRQQMPSGNLWDLGGGIGVLALAASHMGYHATNVDDYRDQTEDVRAAILQVLSDNGVRPVEHDLSELLTFDEEVHVVCSMHTIEHMHGSPREQYHEAVRALVPGGKLIIAGPNAVNARKRISYLLGTAQWSPMNEWYERPQFRGHVREPRVADLRYIARDLGVDGDVIGKNYVGARRPGWRGLVARAVGPLLERRPALCSDLYLVATKPSSVTAAVEDERAMARGT